MTIRFLFTALSASLFTAFVASLSGADLVDSYHWKPLKIGGGGYVTGLDASPSEKGVIFVRTDVSGAYRWDDAASQWKQIVTTASMPEGSLGYPNYGGVDSIVSAPKDSNVVYMAFAGSPYKAVAGEIYKSTNRGDKWVATSFRSCGVLMEPNGIGRQVGERLAVDPTNSDVVYFGSIQNGLWRTFDGGASWTKVEEVGSGIPLYGVTSVIFDKGSGVSNSLTNVIYVTVEEGGIFKSADAGKTWNNVADAGPKSTGKARDAEIGPDRTYYVVFDSSKSLIGAVWKLSPSGAWTDITPQDPEPAKEAGNKPCWDIAIDPFDPNHLVVMRNGGKSFISRDQGDTWTYHSFKLKSPTAEWQGKQINYYLSVGEIAFDPFDRGKLWFAEGFGVWLAGDLAQKDIEWTSVSQGIEEMCGNDVIAPPGGNPVAAMWDIGAFYFSDPDSYTAVKSHPGFMSCWSLDWCPADPKFIVGVFRSHLDFVPFANSAGYSTDGGRNWVRFRAVERKAVPGNLEYGAIAVSAGSTDRIVWAPAGKVLPYYTTDRGATWKQSAFDHLAETGLSGYHVPSKPLCADRVLSDTFYLYTPTDGVYRSTDGGASFSKAGELAPGGAKGCNGIMKSTPGQAGHLWFAEGVNRGAWRSTDGGTSWERLSGIQVAYNIGIGKPKEEGGYPTIFLVGDMEDGKHGIFRSVDEGASWDQIADYPLGIVDYIDAIEGDKQEFGKVYIGFSGSGFAYGTEH